MSQQDKLYTSLRMCLLRMTKTIRRCRLNRLLLQFQMSSIQQDKLNKISQSLSTVQPDKYSMCHNKMRSKLNNLSHKNHNHKSHMNMYKHIDPRSKQQRD